MNQNVGVEAVVAVIVVDFKRRVIVSNATHSNAKMLEISKKELFSVDIYTDQMERYSFNVTEASPDDALLAAKHLVSMVSIPGVRCMASYSNAIENRAENAEALKLYFPHKDINDQLSIVSNERN